MRAALSRTIRVGVGVLVGAALACCGDAPQEESGWPSPRPAGAPEYMRIEPGTFTMGSDDVYEILHYETMIPEHEVTLTRPFCMQATEVTRGQWRRLMGTEPSWWATCVDEFEAGESCWIPGLGPTVFDGWWVECEEGCPVEFVSWWDAIAYCNALSESEGRETCYDLSSCDGTPGNGDFECSWFIEVSLDCTGYRLPIEAEWEYAARAGTGTDREFPCGALNPPSDSCPGDYAWVGKNSDAHPHVVGIRRPNAWGLYDMIGNVWEFTGDWFSWYTEAPLLDPQPAPDMDDLGRVARGGNYYEFVGNMTTYQRGYLRPGSRYLWQGFRVARTIAQDAAPDPNCPSGAAGPQ